MRRPWAIPPFPAARTLVGKVCDSPVRGGRRRKLTNRRAAAPSFGYTRQDGANPEATNRKENDGGTSRFCGSAWAVVRGHIGSLAGTRAKAGWHPQAVFFRQPSQHVDP